MAENERITGDTLLLGLLSVSVDQVDCLPRPRAERGMMATAP